MKSLSKDDGENNENGKKAIGLEKQQLCTLFSSYTS